MPVNPDSPAARRAVVSCPPVVRMIHASNAACHLRAVLAVQRDAFSRVASDLGIDPSHLPPLRETLADLLRQQAAGTSFYAAYEGHRVIGSVRAACADGPFVDVGRLVVASHRLRRGVATALMDALESDHVDSSTLRLFTGAEATGALALYQARGYRLVRTDRSGPVELVWLCKYPETHA